MKEITLGITGTCSNNRGYSGTVLTPTDLKTSSRFKIGSLLVLLIFGLAMFMPAIINAQNPSLRGVAPVNNPTGGFDIDADLYANFRQPSTATNFGDWIYDPALYPGAGRGVLTLQGIPIDPLVTRHSIDLTGNADLDGFTEGSKFNMSPEDWVIEAHSNPGKDDMQNVMIHFDYEPNTADLNDDLDGDLWFIMAGDRMETNGTSYLDFELFQKTVALDGAGGYTSEGTDGGRTVGDLVISIEYSNGGVRPQVFVYRWQSVGSKQGVEQFDYILYDEADFPPNTVYAASNIEGPISVPYGAFGSTTYAQFAFVEAAVNLFKIIPNIDRCKSIATVLVKTKASDALNAALKDVVEPIQIEINPNPAPTIANLALCESEAGSGSASFNLNEGVTEEDGGTITFHTSQEFADEGTNAIENPETYISSGETIFVRSYNALTTCFGTAQFTLTVNPAVVTNAGSDDSVCYDDGTNQMTLNGSASGGTAPYTYSWSGDTTYLSATNVAGPTHDNAPVGTYNLTLTVTDDNGCQDTDTVILVVDPNPTANAGSDDSVCYDGGTNQMTLNGSASGGTAPYTYSWSGDTTYLSATNVAGPTHDNAPVGTYNLTLTVTDDNGCQDTDTVTLVVDPNPTANAGSDDSVCYDGGTNQMTLNGSASGGTAPYTYSWSGDTTYLSATNVAGPTHDNAPVGTYNLTLTVTDDNGCQDTDTVILVVDPNPTFTTDEPQLTCFGEAPSIAVTSDTTGLEFRLVKKGESGSFADYPGPYSGLDYNTTYVLTARSKTGPTYCEKDYEFKTDIQIDIPAIVQLTVNSPTCGSYDGSTYFGSIQIDNHVPGYLYAVVDQATFVDIESVPVSAYMNYDGTSGLISGVAVGEYYVIAKSPDGCLSAIAPAILLTPDCLTCETAFAKDSDRADGKDSSYCFIYDNVPNYENSLTEERWGWTNEYTQAEYTTWTESDPLVLDLYAAAGQCDILKGALAGYVEVYFVPNGKAPGAGTFVVEYISNETELGWLIEGAQFYIGEDPYPKNGKGKNAGEYTVAPGKYPFTIDTDATNHIMLDALECDGVEKIYIIAHAEVCTANSTAYQDKLWDEAQTEYFNINIKNNSIIYAEPTKGGKTQVSTSTTSLSESSEPIFSIAPVPFKDVLNIGYLFDYTSDVTIQVFDLNGRLLTTYKDTAVNSDSISTFNVDFRTKSNQIYIVRMTTDREVYSAKIISEK